MALTGFSPGSFSVYTYFALFVTLYLFAFRLWKFTIRPLLRPDEPRELPYWIPYIGHSYAFVKSGHDVVMQAKAYFKNTCEPFALQLKDRKMYFLLHPDDVAAAYRNTATMSFERIVMQLQRTFLISESTMEAAWAIPSSQLEDKIQTIAGVENPALRSLGDLSMDFWKIQVAGQQYEAIETRFTGLIMEELDKEVARVGAEYGGESKLLPLLRKVFLTAGMRAFFGDQLLEVDAEFVAKYTAFDYQSWKLWFKWPFSKTMFENKRKVEESLMKWLRVPREERKDVAYLIDVIEKTQRAIGTPVDDLARIFNMIIYIINTNTFKTAYWATAHMLTTLSIRENIQQEVAQARQLLTASQSLNQSYLTHLRNKTPRITALLQESLRTYSTSSSIRLTLAPVPIGKRIIPDKSVVFIPFRPQHFDPQVFGTNTNTFHPDRFFKNKALNKSQSFKPFSSGSSYCPGRVLARMELATFLAELLGKYEVEADGEVPPADENTPTKGIITPTEGADITIRISPKLKVVI